MDIFLPAERPRTGPGLSASVYRQIRDAIVAGRLKAGDRLPPSRLLASDVGVSRHTITTAYGRLVAEGYLEGSSGGGTRVAAAVAAIPAPGNDPSPSIEPVTAPPASGLEREPTGEARSRLDLQLGVPDPSLFPIDEWRRRLARQLRTTSSLLAPGDPAGEPATREAIAAWAARSRGVRASAGDVVVTAGARHAFDLLLAALVRPGDVVAVEDPGYRPFHELARARGATVVGVPVDEGGLITGALPAGVRAIHVTPSHQFPLGCTLRLQRRRELLAWASEHATTIVEDDYDSELRYSQRPLEPLQLLDPDHVVYVGTFSKSLSPALRLGYLIAPPSLRVALASIRELSGSVPDRFTQGALAAMLTDGTFARHLHRARRTYEARHHRMVERIPVAFGGIGELVPSTAGLHVTLRLTAEQDEAELIAGARGEGIGIEPLSTYAFANPVHGLCLGFGNIALDDLDEALDRLSLVASRHAAVSRRSG